MKSWELNRSTFASEAFWAKPRMIKAHRLLSATYCLLVLVCASTVAVGQGGTGKLPPMRPPVTNPGRMPMPPRKRPAPPPTTVNRGLLRTVTLEMPHDDEYSCNTITKTVTVQGSIDRTGKFVDWKPDRGCPTHLSLITKDLDAQRFEPAMDDGRPLKSIGFIKYVFTDPKSDTNANLATPSTSNIDTTNLSLPKVPANPLMPLHSFDFVTVTLDKEGKLKKRETKTANAFTEDLGESVKLEMVAIPPGEFTMGSAASESTEYATNERPLHRVRIGYWFYMGRFEITQSQWRAIMGTNPSQFKGCDECPVESVTWDDATEFCRKLSVRTGRKYRLPSEAEWEYSARAGTITPFALGETIFTDVANYNGNRPYRNASNGIKRDKTIPVGSLGVANSFGLCDMHGNVEEWCQDRYSDNYNGAPTDGSAWLIGDDRVIRGGHWRGSALMSRSAFRNSAKPDDSANFGGFRVVAVAQGQ